MDGNVRRVLSRLFDEPDPKPAWLRETAGALVDPDRPGDWNQALMELGATVCAARRPACPSCPVSGWCGARAAGT
ncbi:MAG: A/G-specific adenine glycosylase, partial [Gemmatimonadetes bacterium]|nr:A/G-specific adenine glycosylase [Gemmatimonadota bacterium]NIV62715.1 A/G-specific adenine glycosylase [Gemmatimonadota bacterium]